jgi:arylsulfatase A-like enzyme
MQVMLDRDLAALYGVDENLGRVLKYLDDQKLADNTLVIYTSDNGFFLGEHGWYDKRWMFEESLSMPFVIRWPGVIQPGADLVEIVPLEDTLLVEARVRPPDIAFLRPGLPATVKVTAYDFSIYGGLDATVEEISADAITDEQRGESFFRVRVRTEKNHLGVDHDPLPIIPGMTTQVDIMTGEKTVLNYLLKPIRRAQERALRER